MRAGPPEPSKTFRKGGAQSARARPPPGAFARCRQSAPCRLKPAFRPERRLQPAGVTDISRTRPPPPHLVNLSLVSELHMGIEGLGETGRHELTRIGTNS